MLCCIVLCYRGVHTLAKVVKRFVASDYAGYLDSKKSILGYMFTAYGESISWRSSLQNVLEFTTMEAEYIAMTKAIKDGIWLQGFIKELGIIQEDMVICCDFQNALHLMKNTVHHEISKHIYIKLHFIR